ncbi:hypothetical protein [Brassicibacter mesophilus]|uniref:hypothetical protein n=1 Tax=Brassicibacter mesophilus TaxID=745119 RepID=UPI003D23A281
MSDKNDVVIIKLDRPRMLWFGHRALKTLTAMTGKGMDDFVEMDDINFEDIEKIMYCGLLTDAKNNNEALKLEDMEELLDLVPFGKLIEYIEKAFAAAFGNFGEQEKNDQRIAAQKKKK